MNKNFVTALVALGVSAAIGGCGKSEPENSGSDGNMNAAAQQARPAIPTQPIATPCEWIPVAEVEGVIGKLQRAPRRGFVGHTPRPDAEGDACLYPLPGRQGELIEVAMKVDLYGAAEFESAMGMMGGVFARELNGPGAEAEKEKRTDGWDFVTAMPGEGVWRVGHVAVHFSDSQLLVSNEKKQQLADMIRIRLKDLPFAVPGGQSPGAAGQDPCGLIRRAEAEQALGKLLVEPYRSVENGAIADASGPSCSYYTSGHRALVVTPTWSDGKMMFNMAGGVGSMVRSATGGADEGDLLDGPWEKATRGSSGSLFFLKEDKMIEIRYQTSAADIEGAATLAKLAVPRL